jgi:hypothetical protein
MKFGYTIVYVRDVAASLAFFERCPDGTLVELCTPMG